MSATKKWPPVRCGPAASLAPIFPVVNTECFGARDDSFTSGVNTDNKITGAEARVKDFRRFFVAYFPPSRTKTRLKASDSRNGDC